MATIPPTTAPPSTRRRRAPVELTLGALNVLAALDRAATPGPWDGTGGSVETVPDFDLHRFDVMSETVATVRLNDADAALIAAVRNALPALLAAGREALAPARALNECPACAVGQHDLCGGLCSCCNGLGRS